MIKPRHPSQNPYWHEYHKPHVVDPEEIKSLCLQCLHIVLSSNAISMLWVDDDDDPAWEYPNLAGLHHKSAEALLSNALIKLAVLIRVFDDQLSYIGEDQGYTSYKKVLIANKVLLALFTKAPDCWVSEKAATKLSMQKIFGLFMTMIAVLVMRGAGL